MGIMNNRELRVRLLKVAQHHGNTLSKVVKIEILLVSSINKNFTEIRQMQYCILFVTCDENETSQFFDELTPIARSTLYIYEERVHRAFPMISRATTESPFVSSDTLPASFEKAVLSVLTS